LTLIGHNDCIGVKMTNLHKIKKNPVTYYETIRYAKLKLWHTLCNSLSELVNQQT